jgi:hypothetical protein
MSEMDVENSTLGKRQARWNVLATVSPNAKTSRSQDGTRIALTGYNENVDIQAGDAFYFRDDTEIMLGVAQRAKTVTSRCGRVMWEVRVIYAADILYAKLGHEAFLDLLGQQEATTISRIVVQPRTRIEDFDMEHEAFISDRFMDVQPSCILNKVVVLEPAQAKAWFSRKMMPLPGSVKIVTLKYDHQAGKLRMKRQRLMGGVAKVLVLDTVCATVVTCILHL